MAEPTKWYLAMTPEANGGAPTAAMRIYWPESSLVEKYDRTTGQWVDAKTITDSDMLQVLSEDTGWVEVPADQADNFTSSAAAPAPPA